MLLAPKRLYLADLAVKVFDILYLNDTCLTGKRLSERKRLLRSNKIFQNLDDYVGRIEFVDEERGRTGKDIRAMLERVLEQKLAHHGRVALTREEVKGLSSRKRTVPILPTRGDQIG